jgi:hypothetical protein
MLRTKTVVGGEDERGYVNLVVMNDDDGGFSV